MKVFLAGIGSLKNELENGIAVPQEMFVLESFYSVKDWFVPYIPKFKDFLLDSGAYSFVQSGGSKKKLSWDEYVERYAAFVKNNRVKHYFELDIDSIVGLPEVERLRRRLESRTGTQTIPVWHYNRGKEYFERMCQEYPYVAIGGLVGKKVALNMERYFPWFIQTAHKHGAKIHGLGFTKTRELKKYHFDSVDSTTWTNAGRFGEIHRFTGTHIERVTSIENGRKVRSLKDTKAGAWHNCKEWIKFQRYAENE